MHEIFFLSDILFTSCYFTCTCLVLEISLFGSIIVKHIILFHSSQLRLIPYLHQRPIFFKTNSSIVAIVELIRGAQCLIEVIRSSGEEMWRVDAYQILTWIILPPLSALSLDEGLNALSGKNPSVAGWFSRPIKCQILARMRISYSL